MRRLVAIFAVLGAALIAAGCTSSAGGPKASGTPKASSSATITPLPGPPQQASFPTTLAGYYKQRLSWEPCETYFECSWLTVPADYSHPRGYRFELPVVKLSAADPADRIGALVINPGGPGGSGVDYALSARTGEFTQEVLDRFDIVGFDPRGVGNSRPALRCMSGPQLDQYFEAGAYPITGADLPGVISVSKEYASACAKNAGALLPYVSTADSAKDMDVLRAALGESKLTYLGKSYGTFLGASYAAQFPSKIRALVLDGAVDPSMSGPQSDIVQAEGFEQAFGQFASWCASQQGCPFGTDAASAVPKTEGLLTQASRKPLTNEVDSTQKANGPMLLEGITAALYSKKDWPYLKDGISQALAGDGSMLVEFANSLLERNTNGTYSNLSDVFMSVECVDRPWPKSVTDWQAAANQAAKAAPLFGAADLWGSLPCAYWPAPEVPAVTTSALSSAGHVAAGAPLILVVGDLHDPATPYSWAQSLSRDLSSGVLLGWNGEGHTSYMEGSTCVDNMVDQYLINLRTPRSGTVCS